MQKAGGVGGWDVKIKKTFTNRRGKMGGGGHEKITASRAGGPQLGILGQKTPCCRELSCALQGVQHHTAGWWHSPPQPPPAQN